MRIRRAVAAAAATAVIAPAALLAAAPAYADETAGGTGETTSQTEGDPKSDETEDTATEGEGTSADEDGTSNEENTTEDENATSDEDENASDDENSTSDEDENASDDENADESEDEDGSKEEDEDADESEEPVLEECLITGTDEDLVSTLNGLPAQIAAGSGWQNFSLTVTNKTGAKMDFAQAHVYTYAFDENGEDHSDHLSLQVKDIDGIWVDVDMDWSSDQLGYVGNGSLDKDEASTLQLRIQVDEKAPDSLGVAFSYAFYLTDADDETCADNYSEDYLFEIIAAGKKPNGNDAKPQGGKTKLPAKPDSKPDANLKLEGELAETGSNSNLPMFAIAGAAAIALGGGAMFVVRRRKDADATA
ncbi:MULTISPECIES: LAETG motif-containing sortase-dependent surface protein [unclassified Streptomyces]|uniref:LAETG motif-containing sortase-dependent surface protein n=1 Tax=unclassified Streptomyces TaxID=2593676 RepID=UPI0022B6E546|nr:MULTISPECIES: LAETG motif-containing sortase-dependent surface protein [unclassified Streptomyces]MCZ7417142.1 LPXTG cell wall anchor domain-containing protein [Streptomyces sp. WMMC897]MCZ7433029.1 LPXTG cell wall anchor domain-containing protein [Streptomyces sp. WMMC1477]